MGAPAHWNLSAKLVATTGSMWRANPAWTTPSSTALPLVLTNCPTRSSLRTPQTHTVARTPSRSPCEFHALLTTCCPSILSISPMQDQYSHSLFSTQMQQLTSTILNLLVMNSRTAMQLLCFLLPLTWTVSMEGFKTLLEFYVIIFKLYLFMNDTFTATFIPFFYCCNQKPSCIRKERDIGSDKWDIDSSNYCCNSQTHLDA